MSDKNKQEKLAAAKKRLKQFQAQSQAQTNAVAASADPTPASTAVESAPTVAAVATLTPDASSVPAPAAAGHENGNRAAEQQAAEPNCDVSMATSHPVKTADELAAMQTALAAAHEAVHIERQRSDVLHGQVHQLQAHVHQLTVDHQQQQQQHSHDSPTTVSDAHLQHTADLQQQLGAHAQTIAVLVGEKSDLAAGLAKFQSLAREKITEVEELQGRLNASRHRVQTLERDVAGARDAAQKLEQSRLALCTELETAHETVGAKQRQIDELADDRAELRQQLAVRKTDAADVQQQLQHARYELGLAQLKVKQLGDGGEPGGDGGDLSELLHEKAAGRQRIEELELALERLTAERDQSGEQYQTYVQQLTADNGRMAQQLHEYAEQNGQLAARESSLVQHLGDLERQMQQQMARQQANAAATFATDAATATTTAAAEVDTSPPADGGSPLRLVNEQLSSENAQQVLQIAELREQLAANVENIERLESELERTQAELPDAKSLLGTMQGDKQTASRAVTQNVQLKQQLEELQQAFVQLSNDKLELTERLQSEQYLGRENKFNADQRLEQMNSIKEKLHFKDEEMIRLSHENEERSKEVLQLTLEVDRLRHYESKAQSNAIVQQHANDAIARLQNRIKQLQLGAQQPVEQPADATNADNVAAPEPTAPANDEVDTSSSSDHSPLLEPEHMPTEEAMERLQERFTRTMSDIADLTEEKNRLEHLVMQLQGETETIGEYIALYQSQRQQLKQRELEKDAQMQTIVHDREEMRQKLVQLDQLVERLIDRPPDASSASSSSSIASANALPAETLPATTTTDGQHETSSPSAVGDSTAAQIRHLLDEIQHKNQSKQFCNQTLPDIHQCACCYGKLETV